VSHANVHLVDFGIPVKVGGVWINPGDLLDGDQHGVVMIPHEIAERIPDAAERVAADEQRIIQACQGEGITVERLKAAYKIRPPDASGLGLSWPAPHFPPPFTAPFWSVPSGAAVQRSKRNEG